MSSLFNHIYWYRLKIDLINVRYGPIVKEHPVSIIQAIIKGTTSNAFPGQDISQYPILFHIKNKSHKFQLYENSLVPIEVFFVRMSEDEIEQWRKSLQDYLNHPETGKNFDIVNISPIEQRNLKCLYDELDVNHLRTNELCLDFLMPVPFKPTKNCNRTFIDKNQFIQLFTERFRRLFNHNFNYQREQDDFALLPYYWRYTEIRHFDKNNPKKIQYINGCFGRLYLKGKFSDFLPYLILGSELHCGTRLANSQGYYRLYLASLGYFDRYLSNKSAIIQTIRNVIEKYDSVETELSTTKQPFNEETLAEELLSAVKQRSYQPSPNKAFLIKKKSGGERLIEQVSFKDLILQQYLLKILYPIFENIFEPESIGYRHGVSREKAVAMVKEAISQGYQYVIESDIEDFFPSVDLNILKKLIDFYLPAKDVMTRDLLQKFIDNSYVLDNKICTRKQGLAVGSPLSALLANLYLDAFDEKIKQWDVKLIRYADDFIILAKTKSDAENILSQTETYLSELGLKLNRTKTAIKPIKGGFSFLGIRFERSEIKVEPEAEIRLLKKPLYITEPYCYLGINGDAISIIKEQVVREIIPLRRISEIIILEKSSLSTALIRKCTEANIPVTITLNNGYYITTIKPDSKEYYNINYEHSKRYFSLTDSEFLCLAKEVAVGKIKNYISLFKQKYTAGMNEFIKELEATIQNIYQAGDINAVRGLEGIISRRIYEQLNNFIDEPQFHIKKRDRKNPDMINSLLNLGYYALFSKINATLRAVGLNPYLGFLHSPADNYESLACDIQDLFRARIDRLIIKLINLKVITTQDFSQRQNRYYLKHEATKKFINHLEAEFEKKDTKKELSLKEQIYIQAMIIKQWVLQERSLTFYTWQV